MSGWMRVQDAVQLLSTKRQGDNAQQIILDAISGKLIRARAFRAIVTNLGFPVKDDEMIRKHLESTEWLFDNQLSYIGGDGRRREICDHHPFSSWNAYLFRDAPDGVWAKRIDWEPESRREVKADWKQGNFHRRYLAYSGQLWPEETVADGFTLIEEDWYSLEVEEEATRRILIGSDYKPSKPPKEMELAHEGRATLHDWEAAFADVAARFYWDTQFDDINARGVQARIVELLSDSFLGRNMSVPANSSLKEKAKKLLGALRATNG